MIVPMILGISLAAVEAPPNSALAELRQRLSAHISQSKYDTALWGVKVVSQDTGKTVFELNQQKLFTPASNTKLYTTALALDRLGPDYRIKTSIYARGKPDGTGTVPGDLIIYGRGDPSFNAHFDHGSLSNALLPLVAALSHAGIKRIAGDLIGDSTFFRGAPFGSGWVWEDLQQRFGAEISALTINDNTLRLRVKPGERVDTPCVLSLIPSPSFIILSNRTLTVEKHGRKAIQFERPITENILHVFGQMPLDGTPLVEEITVHEPALLFVSFLSSLLPSHGIELMGKPRALGHFERPAAPATIGELIELGSVESPPLRNLIRETVKPSQNLYADLLLAHMGEKARTSETLPEMRSEELGIRELGKFLVRANVRRGDVLFEEGSGLSRNNLCTPEATVALLQFMTQHPAGDIFLDALPIAGVDGTLQQRMKDTPAQGNLRAKTGTLRYDSTLSGQVKTAAGERLLFSIMLNRFHSTEPARPGAEVDAIAVMLAEFKGRSDE